MSPSRHFAVVAPAFFSHFNALEAIAVALIERGHRVTFLHRIDAKAFCATLVPAFMRSAPLRILQVR